MLFFCRFEQEKKYIKNIYTLLINIINKVRVFFYIYIFHFVISDNDTKTVRVALSFCRFCR